MNRMADYPEHMPSDELLQDSLDQAVLDLFQPPPLANRNGKPAPSTFITTIYAGLQFSWDLSIPTACTNGLFLKINPWFWLGLDRPTRSTVLAHETWHVAFDHMARFDFPDCDHRTANIAADNAINLMLKDFGYVFNTDHIAEDRFRDMTAEAIYEVLKGENPPDNPFAGDFVIGDSNMSPSQKAAVTGLIIRAYTASKMNKAEAGSLPGAIEESMDELLNPKLPWYVLLARYLNERSEEGYNWRAPNRRFAVHNVYLPTKGGQEGLARIYWAVDDSGSIGEEDLKRANSEMKGAKERLKPKEMTVISFDTQIQDRWEFTDENDLGKLTFTGRGGTNLTPIMELAKKEKPNLLVVFSDLECDEPADPGVPVLWVRIGNRGFHPSFGRTIQIDRG